MIKEKGHKAIALAYIFVAIGIVLFWIGFFSELIFPVDTLKPLIKNFEGYYAWETSFAIPDLIMAFFLLIGSYKILKSPKGIIGKLILAPAVGASVFLGVLDFVYAIRNGMYQLDHIFSYVLMSIGIGLPILGIISLHLLIQSIELEYS